jgi:hypothetical protein
VTELPYSDRIAGPDRCVVAEDHRHVVRHTRRRRYRSRNRKTRNRRRR